MYSGLGTAVWELPFAQAWGRIAIDGQWILPPHPLDRIATLHGSERGWEVSNRCWKEFRKSQRFSFAKQQSPQPARVS